MICVNLWQVTPIVGELLWYGRLVNFVSQTNMLEKDGFYSKVVLNQPISIAVWGLFIVLMTNWEDIHYLRSLNLLSRLSTNLSFSWGFQCGTTSQ